jgi:anti-sigma factor RsiW
MNCEELRQYLPDLVDGSLAPELLAEAQAALAECPDCQREYEIAQRVRAFLIELQAENANIRIPAGFEARLLARVRAHHSGLELLDLSSQAFGAWLVELLNLIGGLIDPIASGRSQVQ